MTQKFISIRLNTLRSNKPFGFTILLKLNNNFIKYINPEDDIDQQRLDNLKSKGLKKVYIDAADEGEYHKFLDKLLGAVGQTSTGEMAAGVKSMVLAGATADSLEKVYADPDNKYAYESTKKAASSLVSATQMTPDIFKEIFNIDADDDVSINCAICTSTTAISLGRKLGLNPMELEMLGLAALLCDISLVTMMKDYQGFFTKGINEFTQEEAVIYKQHPLKSAELLQSKEFSTTELLSIVANHEEKLNGKGFPKGITMLSQMEKIVSLSNRFSVLIVAMKLSKENAIKELVLQDAGAYDLEMINILKSMIGGK